MNLLLPDVAFLLKYFYCVVSHLLFFQLTRTEVINERNSSRRESKKENEFHLSASLWCGEHLSDLVVRIQNLFYLLIYLALNTEVLT